MFGYTKPNHKEYEFICTLVIMWQPPELLIDCQIGVRGRENESVYLSVRLLLVSGQCEFDK